VALQALHHARTRYNACAMIPPHHTPAFFARLAAHSDAADRTADWPALSWAALRESGLLAGAVPAADGGAGWGVTELHAANEAVAAACLTTAFVLSQRDAAVRRIAGGPDDLRRRYLPGLASGELFATVGLSQLTTSRQHGAPAVSVTPTPDGYRIDGEVPWVTGADRADVIVIGGTLPDATQAVFAVPAGTPGLTVGPPMMLAALAGSRTTWVRCDGVELTDEHLLAGPAVDVLGRLGGGGLDTSNLAVGLAAAAAGAVRDAAGYRPDLSDRAERMTAAVEAARARLHHLATAPPAPEATLALRADCTRLALAATQAALILAKGAGFVAPHPAQRWARQALFFLVWSCPRPAADGVLGELLDLA